MDQVICVARKFVPKACALLVTPLLIEPVIGDGYLLCLLVPAPCDFEFYQALVESVQIQAAGVDIGRDECGMKFPLAIRCAFFMPVQPGRVFQFESDDFIAAGGRQAGMVITEAG